MTTTITTIVYILIAALMSYKFSEYTKKK